MYYSDEDYDNYDSGDFHGPSSDNEFDDDPHDHCGTFYDDKFYEEEAELFENGKILHWRISRVLLMEINAAVQDQNSTRSFISTV
jgi:hypothetical protein